MAKLSKTFKVTKLNRINLLRNNNTRNLCVVHNRPTGTYHNHKS